MSNMCEICTHYEVCVYEDEAIVECTNYQADADQWIPCSERLPDNFDDVIITTDRGDMEFGWYNKILEKWFSDNMIVNVTAWMPLPEPYKGEQNDR